MANGKFMLTLPGLIDPHVHFRDPGQTEKEDFFSGTCAALAGGFTTVLDMPNNAVPITTQELLKEKQKVASKKIVCDVGFHFGSLGNNLEEFEKVKEKVFGLKLYLNVTTGNFIIDDKVFEKIAQEWSNVIARSVSDLPAGRQSKQSHPILVHAEEDIIETIISIAHKTECNLHVCHVSSEKELRAVIKAKEKGWKVTCGVTPHHLFLTQDGKPFLTVAGLRQAQTLSSPKGWSDELTTPGVTGWSEAEAMAPRGWTSVKPSLKSKSDVDFLWQHLNDIDIIESDHAPHTLEDKQKGAFGFPGLETTLPLLLTAAHQNKLTINDIIRLCHDTPAKIFGIMDHLNTYIEVDENEEWTIQNENLKTKCKWSPYNRWKVKGRVKRVFLRGTKVYEDDKILAEPGFGKIL